MVDLSALPKGNQRAIWRRFLLAEMGITPWVQQQKKVHSFDIERFYTYQDISSHIQPVFEKSVQSEYHEARNIEAHQNDDELSEKSISIADLINLDFQQEDLQNTIQEETKVYQSLEESCHFQLQAIVFKQWILLADSKILQNDESQKQLWQQISRGLSAQIQQMTFPLVEESQIPLLQTVDFASQHLAIASFLGFLCGLSVNQQKKIGNLTILPDYLQQENIQQLPTLIEMLDNQEKKRQLWQLIND